MRPPGHEFYAATAQLIPLLLLAMTVEERETKRQLREQVVVGADRLAALSEVTDVSMLAGAVAGECAAIAGLVGNGSRNTAALCLIALGLVGAAVTLQLTTSYLIRGSNLSGFRRSARLIAGFGVATSVLALGIGYGLAMTL